MEPAIQIQHPAEQIADLKARLLAAEQRATVAEAQLRRVHTAVRAFKLKQMQARAAQQEARQRNEVPASASYFDALGHDDHSLDERLDEFMDSDFEPDRSRSWMLSL